MDVLPGLVNRNDIVPHETDPRRLRQQRLDRLRGCAAGYVAAKGEDRNPAGADDVLGRDRGKDVETGKRLAHQ
jgi:hypothetical protein